MRNLAARASTLVLVSLYFAAGGCGKPVLRVADASLGDYYTREEYQKLNKEQREEYCRELAEQRDLYQDDVADAEEALAALDARYFPLRGEVEALRAAADSMEQRVTAALAQPSPVRPNGAGPTKAIYVVKRGDSLWSISARPGVFGRSQDWPRIYEANRDRIRDSSRIYPGQEIQIPR